MKILVIGTGYVGLVQGVCLAELGNEVTCLDIDEAKIKNLRQGISPIYEPGIEELISNNLTAKRITFETSIKKAIRGAEVIFVAVGTPPDENGRADLKYVLQAAEDIGKNLDHYVIVVNKSTVPIGTGELVKKTIKKFYKGSFDVCSNPEFLREGSAINDFMNPDRIVIGDNNGQKAAKVVAKVYEVLKSPILITNLETAEMIKYASNSYLATQISFINSVALICEQVGADVSEVSAGMKLDKRIGPRAFLSAGLGYGGSCFPKDVQALIRIADDNQVDFGILKETEALNKNQRLRFIQKVKSVIGDLEGKKIALWGIAFKPKTDDVRDAPAMTIIEALLNFKAKVIAYDPVAEKNTKIIYPKVKFVKRSLEAVDDADALLIITEWDEFKQVDLQKVKVLMKKPRVFDGRNIYDPAEMRKFGFEYYSIGRM
jgi:UDPglucose 6-dehydrogenase